MCQESVPGREFSMAMSMLACRGASPTPPLLPPAPTIGSDAAPATSSAGVQSPERPPAARLAA
jgi:hypothetical protein